MATQRLFFALLPPPPARAALRLAAARLRAAAVLRGKWLKPEKYHVTLQFLGTFETVPDAVIERAAAAAAGVHAAPFEFTLDRLASFKRRQRSPCVLHAAAGCLPAVGALYDMLGAALHAHDVPSEQGRPYAPHLTLAYGDLPHERELDEPISWQVRDFALLRSRVAEGAHDVLATWKLARG